MEKAQSLGKLYSSLAEVINRIENPKNGMMNNEFGSSYIPLSEVISIVKNAMKDSGNHLSFVQIPEVMYERLNPNYELGVVKITTRIIHNSGEFIDFTPVIFKAGGNTPQAIGSAMTYAKRYSLTSIFGISGKEEDDDGNAGSDRPSTNNENEGNQREQPIAPNNVNNHQQDNVYEKLNDKADNSVAFINEDSQKNLHSIAKEISQVRNVEVKTILTALGKPLDQIADDEYDVYFKRLSSWLKKAKEQSPKPSTEQKDTPEESPKDSGQNEQVKSFTVKAVKPRNTPDGQKFLEVFVEGSNKSLLCRTDEEKQHASQLEIGDTFTGEIQSDGVFLFLIGIENIVKSA